MARRKKVKAQIGDVFAIPISGNRYCFGQSISQRLMSKLYILFDFVSNEVLDIEKIVKEPIFAIAYLTDLSIEDGHWLVLGNIEIPIKNLIYPHYLMGPEPLVYSYDGIVLRKATEKDLQELSYPKTRTSNAFYHLAEAKFGDQEKWKDYYDESLIFKPEKWLIADDNLNKSSNQVDITEEKVQNNEEEQDEDAEIVTVRIPLEEDFFKTVDALDFRFFIEDLLDDHLRNANLGDCDGGEIGNEEMFVFCYVKDRQKAVEMIKAALNEQHLLTICEIVDSVNHTE